MKIDHIGILTEDLSASISVFESLGYKFGGQIFDDDIQQCKICFLQKDDEPKIELVEPYAENRTMQKMLKRQGSGPYHTCHVVDDIKTAYETLVKDGWYAMFEPCKAVAFDNKLICYLFKDEIGYLEIVEK